MVDDRWLMGRLPSTINHFPINHFPRGVSPASAVYGVVTFAGFDHKDEPAELFALT